MAPTWSLTLPLVLALVAPIRAAPDTVPSGDVAVGGYRATAMPAAMASGWAWPVVGPVVRDFDPPEDPYGSGHRGIDIGVPVGTPILAPEAGVVAFAGKVGGQLYVTLDHGGGLQSTYSWIEAAEVRKGDVVARGGRIGTTGLGHPGSTVPHLHFGVRLDGAYLDPLEVLGPAPLPELIHLAPELPVP
jgi:murein DD-endopeptidase MepM/ murein hydrolase activator NlpD